MKKVAQCLADQMVLKGTGTGRRCMITKYLPDNSQHQKLDQEMDVIIAFEAGSTLHCSETVSGVVNTCVEYAEHP